MGTSLTGLTPATTYDALIKVGDNGPLSATAKVLSDGLGNDSPIAMSTTLVGIGTNNPSRALHVKSGTGTAQIESTTSASTLYLADSTSTTIDNQGIGSAGNSITISAGGLERLYVTSAGNVGIGTTTPAGKLQVSGGDVRIFNIGTQMVLGSGIAGAYEIGVTTGTRLDFSLSGTGTYLSILPTGGITFNGDTAAANALDDYEEGTWTPVFSGTTFSGAIGATYTKIGRVVNVQMNFVNQTLSSSSGTAAISGLPFTCNSVTFGMVNFTFCDSLTASVATGYVGVSGTSIQIRTNTGISDTTFIDGTSNKSMMLSATYFV